MPSARKARTAPAWTNSTAQGEGEAATATLPPPPASREDLAYYVRHHLNQTERLVIMLRYAEELAFDEIAGILKMAKDDIEEIHRIVVERLQVSLNISDALAAV